MDGMTDPQMGATKRTSPEDWPVDELVAYLDESAQKIADTLAARRRIEWSLRNLTAALATPSLQKGPNPAPGIARLHATDHRLTAELERETQFYNRLRSAYMTHYPDGSPEHERY